MALRSPFGRKTDQTAAPTQPKGASGRAHTGGYIVEDELNASLIGLRGLNTFDEMWRTDGDVRRTLLMAIAPLVSGTWEVDPYGDDDDGPDPTTDEDREIAAFVEWNLWDAMEPAFDAHLFEALAVAGRSGRAPFETIYKTARWRDRDVVALDCLDLRLPRTIQRYLQDGPRLTGVEQFVIAKGLVTIPAEDLLFYRFGAEGDNWEGSSLLRPAYKHWKYKAGLELMQARALERAGLGVPTGYVPEGTGDAARDEFEDFLAAAAEGKQPYYLAPGPAAQFAEKGQGWHWDYVVPANSHQAAEGFQVGINHHRDSIAATVLVEFMRQGQGKVGTNATAKTQQDPFHVLLDAIAGTVILAPINRHLIPRLVGLNYTTDRLPKLRCSLIDETTLEELSDFVQKLATAGAIRPEPKLEAFLRKRANMPPADEKAIAEADQQKAEQAQAEADRAHAQAVEVATVKGPPAQTPPSKQMSLDVDSTVTLARQDRALKPHETLMSLDRIESAIDGARARFEAACGDSARQMAVDLAAQAQGGKAITPKPGPTELRDAVARELQGLYDVGRSTVREELDRQAFGSVTVPHLLAAADLPGWLRDRAQGAADAVRAAIALALGRSRVRRDQSHADLQQTAERAAMGALRQEAQHHAAAALNAGRTDQADEMAHLIAGSRYTSILDGRRCSTCASADDDVLRPLDDPVRLAHVPPNPDCQGGDRCRCLEAFALKTEAAPAV